MLDYTCENCKKIILWGSVNEYNQHFCDEKCYEKYCKKNGYEAHPEKLYKINLQPSRSEVLCLTLFCVFIIRHILSYCHE